MRIKWDALGAHIEIKNSNEINETKKEKKNVWHKKKRKKETISRQPKRIKCVENERVINKFTKKKMKRE